MLNHHSRLDKPDTVASVIGLEDRLLWTRNAGLGYIYPKTLTDHVGVNTTTPTERLTVQGDSTTVYIDPPTDGTFTYNDYATCDPGVDDCPQWFADETKHGIRVYSYKNIDGVTYYSRDYLEIDAGNDDQQFARGTCYTITYSWTAPVSGADGYFMNFFWGDGFHQYEDGYAQGWWPYTSFEDWDPGNWSPDTVPPHPDEYIGVGDDLILANDCGIKVSTTSALTPFYADAANNRVAVGNNLLVGSTYSTLIPTSVNRAWIQDAVFIGTTVESGGLNIGICRGSWGASIAFTRVSYPNIDNRIAAAPDGLIFRNFDTTATKMYSFRDVNDVHIWDLMAGGRSLFNGATDDASTSVQIGGTASLKCAGTSTFNGNVSFGTVGKYTISTGIFGLGTLVATKRLQVAGTTVDHEIQTDIGLNLNYVVKPTAPTGALGTGGSMTPGAHWYAVTYTTAAGETAPTYTAAQITTDVTNNKVTLTIPVSTDYRVTGRKIYRTQAGDQQYQEYLLATIANNTATSYVDTAVDPASPTKGVAYFRVNSTNYGIRVNDATVMMTDPNYTIFGYNATGTYLTVGGRGTSIGVNAGQSITSGTDNQIFGHSAGDSITSGGGNCAFGYNAIGTVSTGNYNTAIGHNALIYPKTTSAYNVAVGQQAGMGVSTVSVCSYNTFVGVSAGFGVTSGSTNAIFGYNAGYAITDGGNNVFLGAYAGRYETGSQKLFIDNQARTDEATSRTNSLIYGIFNATVASQSLTFNVGSVTVPTAAYYYIGNSGTDGSIRLSNLAGGLRVESRISGVWTDIGGFTVPSGE